jgi:hypothetical protein
MGILIEGIWFIANWCDEPSHVSRIANLTYESLSDMVIYHSKSQRVEFQSAFIIQEAL